MSLVFASSIGAFAQANHGFYGGKPADPRDPGVRGGFAGAGAPLPGLTEDEAASFDLGLDEFLEEQSVQGTIPDTEPGLGPTFNMNSCGGCHAQPATGGTSPFVNPQVDVATLEGAANQVPFFITLNGPVREARFAFKDKNRTSRDGGVTNLFTIAGRTDAPGCSLPQPDFSPATAEARNLIFRVPTPVFGAGLIEMVSDSTIIENMKANAQLKKSLGISGQPNREGNAGTITRFGWKAQNKSLAIFSGEAYLVEQGVTNELFTQERNETPKCLFNPLPEDVTKSNLPSNVELFALFMRFLAPPTPVTATPSELRGRALFESTGCGHCHTPQLTTGVTTVAVLSNKPVGLYSDLLVHNMGPRLADGITQGNAGGSEFRTAPLWGLGQRIFFLHDGRTDDLLVAIRSHASRQGAASDGTVYPASEANGVIANFEALTTAKQQDILNFLRSL